MLQSCIKPLMPCTGMFPRDQTIVVSLLLLSQVTWRVWTSNSRLASSRQDILKCRMTMREYEMCNDEVTKRRKKSSSNEQFRAMWSNKIQETEGMQWRSQTSLKVVSVTINV